MLYFKNYKGDKIAYKILKGKSPGLIFVHGFTSDMETDKALEIERYAKKNKLNFIKFDLRGHGKSSGEINDYYISDWKRDLVDIIDNFSKGPQIIIGHSLGGYLMFLAAQLRKKKVAGLVGLATTAELYKLHISSYTEKQLQKLKKNGYIKIKNKDGREFIFTKKGVQDIKNNEFINKNYKFNKPLTLIHGTNDEVIPYQSVLNILKKIKGDDHNIILMKNSDHSLSQERDKKKYIQSIDNIVKKIK
tara:strand:+ start:83 stop:823 length:741 start_codon:yes stop_codon:yes gene_type:complete